MPESSCDSGHASERCTNSRKKAAGAPLKTAQQPLGRNRETLSNIKLFRSLDASKIKLLDTQCSWRRATPHQWIINYQDDTRDVLFVVSGVARVKLQAVSAREVQLRDIHSGEFFGELAAIDGKPRSSGIIALTEVITARMPPALFQTVVHEHPDVCKQLLEFLAGQIRTLANRVHEFTTLDSKYRIYAELLRWSKPSSGIPNSAVISPPPAQSELAARVSVRREAVGRELRALVAAGLIELRRGAYVLKDVAKLKALIDDASETD